MHVYAYSLFSWAAASSYSVRAASVQAAAMRSETRPLGRDDGKDIAANAITSSPVISACAEVADGSC